MRTIEQMVQQEINCCLSSLIATLSNGSGCVDAHSRNAPNDDAAKALADLAEQAFELSMPIPDYEEALTQAGWESDGADCWFNPETDDGKGESLSAQDVCSNYDIEPIDSDVFEHWAISQWLADKLIEQGEKVDTDFGGLNVWARQTTGPGIASDGVIERIYANMMKGV